MLFTLDDTERPQILTNYNDTRSCLASSYSSYYYCTHMNDDNFASKGPRALSSNSKFDDSSQAHPIEMENEPISTLRLIWEVVLYAIIAAAIILPIRFFIAQPFVVSGSSMFPTFQNGEYLIVDELSRRMSGYQRGDVVILKYPRDPSKYFIKRIIGLPGETVSIRDGVVTIIGKQGGPGVVLDEPYVKNPKMDSETYNLSDTEYYVMGDNRAQSSDSRVWGPVPANLMDGKAFLRLFPPTRINLHPGGLESFGVTTVPAQM